MQEYHLVHCIWSNGKQVQCSQDYDVIKKVMRNGINVYALFPILIIAKRRLFRQLQLGSVNQWFPKLSQGMTFTIKAINTDFCKTATATKQFIDNVWMERRKILNQKILNSTVNEDQLQKWDLFDYDQLIGLIMHQATVFDNFDVDGRHDNDQILAICCPDPRSRAKTRRNGGKLPEEIAFLETMENMPNHSKMLMTSFRTALCRSNELQNQLKLIRNFKKKEFFSPALDVSVADWLSQRKKVSIIDRIQQVRKVMVNIELPEVKGDFQNDINEVENELIGSIIDNLDQINRIQKEKCLLQHIPKRLVGDNCFPELAKIINRKSQNMDICEIISSTTESMDSWTDSWSSE